MFNSIRFYIQTNSGQTNFVETKKKIVLEIID